MINDLIWFNYLLLDHLLAYFIIPFPSLFLISLDLLHFGFDVTSIF